MAIDDDGSDEAVGAEKSPKNVRRFVWALLLGVVIALALMLVFLHFHAPVVHNSFSPLTHPLDSENLATYS